jgi:DNA-binding NtrC family response regulator
MPNDYNSARQLPSLSLAGRKILIAEDESVLAWELEDVLREFGGPRIFSTASLQGARDILEAHLDLSLALLDLKLQDGSGEGLIGELAEKGIPFIIVTGYTSNALQKFPILMKPYSVKALIEAIGRALKLCPS